MKIILSARAVADVVRLRVFLAERNPDAAVRAAKALDAAIDSLRHFPARGRPVGSGERRELVVRFGRSRYIVRYQYFADREAVAVVRIWHGREKRPLKG